MRGSIICSWPWWTDPLTPPLPMKLMKNLLQRALMDKVTRIRSPGTLADRKGSGRGQWTRSFSFTKIWLVHFQVFGILFQNSFRYLVSHISRFWGILVSWGQNSGYIGIPLPPLAGPDNFRLPKGDLKKVELGALAQVIENLERDCWGRLCNIYCTLILWYSFPLCVISDVLWSSCLKVVGTKTLIR